MAKIVALGLALALGYLEIGKLKEATYKVAVMAADATTNGILNLGDFNRSLYGERPRHEKRMHHNREKMISKTQIK